MEIKEKKTKKIHSSIKIIEDKKYIQSYLRGEISQSTLNERGIKLAKPV
ncbi:MAG: hypothetical protein ABR595_07725 [Psychroflexus sp.]